MVKRSERLKRVHTLAETEERDYCRAMAEAQRSLDAHVARLDELRAYRREYATRQADGHSGDTISSARYADYQNFLQRLDEAVHAQSELVRTTQQNRDAHRERWVVKRRRSESLQRVVERCTADELRHRERTQQKVQDDLTLPDHPFRQG